MDRCYFLIRKNIHEFYSHEIYLLLRPLERPRKVQISRYLSVSLSKLTPPDLGNVITFTEGKSEVNFVANHSLSRTMIISTMNEMIRDKDFIQSMWFTIECFGNMFERFITFLTNIPAGIDNHTTNQRWKVKVCQGQSIAEEKKFFLHFSTFSDRIFTYVAMDVTISLYKPIFSPGVL